MDTTIPMRRQSESDVPMPPPIITPPESPSYKKNTIVPYTQAPCGYQMPSPTPFPSPMRNYKKSSIVPIPCTNTCKCDTCRKMTTPKEFIPPHPQTLPQHEMEPVPLVPRFTCIPRKKEKRGTLEDFAYGCMLCMCCCFVPME
jgi:hypothetical protein